MYTPSKKFKMTKMKQPEYVKNLMHGYNEIDDTHQSSIESRALRKALESRSSYVPKDTINGVLSLIIHNTDKLKYDGLSYGTRTRATIKKCARVLTCGGRGVPDLFVVPMIGYPPRYPHDKGMTYTNLFRTHVTENSLRGDWEFTQPLLLTLERDYFLNGKAPVLYFSVMDDDHITVNAKAIDDPFVVGAASLDMREILLSAEYESGIYKGLELKKVHHHKKLHLNKSIGKLYVTYKWTYMDCRPSACPGLKFARYPIRSGNQLTFFQDAYQNKLAPEFIGAPVPPESCWVTLSAELEKSKNFILIVGWSVNYATRLLRHSPDTECLGDLLIRKSNQGVKVFIGVWADMSSNHLDDGVMGTSDAISEKFFLGTKVKFERISRDLWIAGDSMVRDILGSGIFTHHQKVVAMDSEGGAQAFVGGLDLTDGRYDDCDHTLFGTDSSTHQGDQYQGCLSKVPPAGPRQPWHDIHSRVQGPVASDLISNFIDRMRKEVPKWTEELEDVLDTYEKHTPETIEHAGPMLSQVLRSIDSAVCCFKGSPYESLFHGDHIKEISIHHAYVKNIHRAQKFIYIENQYFIGSSGMWLDDTFRGVRANNNVPRSIVSKIVSKIKAREPFHAYVVIPLFPEGIPETDISQTILQWQWVTMTAMYGLIGKALFTEKITGSHPRDYLTFYFPAKREADATNVPSTAGMDAKVKLTIDNRRHMIYVHSKMLIVDDDYILLGSANINERSMNGNRDSEIAVHAWNPWDMTNADDYARGDVHHFRTNLWREHLGGDWQEEFMEPHSYKCIDIVRRRAESNLQAYIGEENRNLPHGHLCNYPMEVHANGSMELRKGIECFPDTTANVSGTRFASYIDALTT